MKVLVTGADGFIGSNLRVALSETAERQVLTVKRSTSDAELRAARPGSLVAREGMAIDL